MSSCTECHGRDGLHTSSNCPRITGARLYTPKQINAEIIAELERLLVNIPSNTNKYAEKIHERVQELKAKETQL